MRFDNIIYVLIIIVAIVFALIGIIYDRAVIKPKYKYLKSIGFRQKMQYPPNEYRGAVYAWEKDGVVITESAIRYTSLDHIKQRYHK